MRPVVAGRISNKLIEIDRGNPLNFNRKLRRLFAAMAKGDAFGADDVPFFNGGLFGNDDILIELEAADLKILRVSSSLDWSRVDPTVASTLVDLTKLCFDDACDLVIPGYFQRGRHVHCLKPLDNYTIQDITYGPGLVA